MKIKDTLFIVSVEVVQTYYMEDSIKKNEIHLVDAKDNDEANRKICDYYNNISEPYGMSYYIADILSINKLIQ